MIIPNMESRLLKSVENGDDPKARRKTSERAHRKDLLLEAAEKVFGQKPFDEASMQEVAALAGIGMQGLYEQFPSKQALYEELILVRAQEFSTRAEASLAGIRDPIEQLRALSRLKVEMVWSRPAFLPVFLRERLQYEWRLNTRSSERFREIYEGERARLKAILELGIRKRQIRNSPPDFLVLLCQECLEAAMLYGVQRGREEGSEPCVEMAMEFFLRGAGA